MKISPRTRKIIDNLCQADAYVTTAQIAQGLAVSNKTIVRELPEVENVLARYGLHLAKKTGAGLAICGSKEKIQNILKEIGRMEEDFAYGPQERQSVIISRLLQRQDPVKLFELATLLKVTEGTISNDLDKLEEWFCQHDLQLVRRPGLGIFVEGDEACIRKAIVQYIYENINEDQLLELVYDNLAAAGHSDDNRQGIGKYLLKLVDKKIIQKLERAVRTVETASGCQLSDNAFMGLVVHLTLAVQRLQKREEIEVDPVFLASLKTKKEFALAADIGRAMERIFAIAVPEAELGYITMHLLGARNRYNQKNGSNSVIDNFHLVKIAKGMMRSAQEATGRPLAGNERLLVGLVNHLGPSISRLKMKMDIRNPLLPDMQQQYPELLTLSKTCAAGLEEELGMELPDSELAYIAMHLGAALEEAVPVRKKGYRIAVACPTGMGTSRMLASRIQKEYKELRIVDLISAVHVDEAALQRLQVEFIISTIPIAGCSLPVVVVNSLLLQDDREKINARLALCDAAAAMSEKEVSPRPDLKKCLLELEQYTQAVVDVLDSFFFAEDCSSTNLLEICTYIGALVASEAEQQQRIRDALLERETYGGTLIKGNQMILLHCRTEAVQHLHFGIIHLEQYQTGEGGRAEPIRTAIVMLAPKDTNGYCLETIGYISTILLDRWGLIEILHEGNQQRIYQELEKIFHEFHERKYKKLMEG